MFYCKNCGKELKEGTRFCDRCGQSVRQGQLSERSKRTRQIEELQRERLNRQKKMKAQEERERRINDIKKQKKVRVNNRKKRKNNIFILVLLGILAIVVSAVISYIVTTMNSNEADWKSNDASVALNSTPIPTMQPSNSMTPSTPMPSVAKILGENKDKTNSEGYRVCELESGIECPYPTGFSKQNTGTNQVLNVSDSVGGGTVKIYSQEFPGGTAASLMKTYSSKLGGDVIDSLAGSGWYTITVSEDGIIHHRKYIIDESSDKALYYDFEYDENSASASDYEKNIDYMDDNFSN